MTSLYGRMTKERLGKIAASIAVAPFYGLAWCFGLLVRMLLAVASAIVMGFSNALFGDKHAFD